MNFYVEEKNMTNNQEKHINTVQHETQTQELQKDFPYIRWLMGAVLGASLAYSSYYNVLSYYDYETVHSFGFYFFLAAIIGLIPMLIAYGREIEKANAVYWFSFAAMCAPAGIIWFVIGVCMAIFGKKVGEKFKIKTEKIKIEIVNNEEYTKYKSDGRIKYLNTLKKQTVSKLNELNKVIEAENKKVKDVPVDIAKYIKPKDTTSLQKEIIQLENKKLAIDELIALEIDDKNKKNEHKVSNKKTSNVEPNNCVKVSVCSGTNSDKNSEEYNDWDDWE